MTDEQFIEECQFAKVVATPFGNSILIAGEVIDIRGPGGSVRDYAAVLARALRREGELRPIAWGGMGDTTEAVSLGENK